MIRTTASNFPCGGECGSLIPGGYGRTTVPSITRERSACSPGPGGLTGVGRHRFRIYNNR
eukprot:scaffold1593_cov143-Isochrysis_galbana.AAC.1